MNWWVIPTGIASGILGGMGMGGGTILIPFLTLLLGWEQHDAQWLNLVAFVPSAVVAVFVHAKHRLLDGKTCTIMLLPALGACIATAYFATRIQGRILTLIFGSFLSLVGVVCLLSTIKQTVRYLRGVIPHEPDDI